jgi:YHS domain-containing protein
MKNILVAVYFLILIFTASSCKKNETTSVVSAKSPEVVMSENSQQPVHVEDFIPPMDQYGSISQCPVMGEKVKIDKTTKAVKYKGKAYYFCCPSCLSQFKSNPDKYAK